MTFPAFPFRARVEGGTARADGSVALILLLLLGLVFAPVIGLHVAAGSLPVSAPDDVAEHPAPPTPSRG